MSATHQRKIGVHTFLLVVIQSISKWGIQNVGRVREGHCTPSYPKRPSRRWSFTSHLALGRWIWKTRYLPKQATGMDSLLPYSTLLRWLNPLGVEDAVPSAPGPGRSEGRTNPTTPHQNR